MLLYLLQCPVHTFHVPLSCPFVCPVPWFVLSLRLYCPFICPVPSLVLSLRLSRLSVCLVRLSTRPSPTVVSKYSSFVRQSSVMSICPSILSDMSCPVMPCPKCVLVPSCSTEGCLSCPVALSSYDPWFHSSRSVEKL